MIFTFAVSPFLQASRLDQANNRITVQLHESDVKFNNGSHDSDSCLTGATTSLCEHLYRVTALLVFMW